MPCPRVNPQNKNATAKKVKKSDKKPNKSINLISLQPFEFFWILSLREFSEEKR